MREFWNAFSQQLKPRFHEISAYSIAFASCWLFVSQPEFRNGVLMFLGGFGPVFMGVGLIVTGGLVLSLVHVFIKRRKSAIEKSIIGWFILGISGMASFFAGVKMLPSRSPLTMILVTWNVVMAILLLLQMAMHTYDIEDEDASLAEVVAATAVLVVILILSDLWLHLSWALTLSICIFYATSIVFAATWAADRLGLELPELWK